ncbi:MAG: hypothetical protein EBZ64_02830 [Betaproteobacteria bacterium]|nr:hypothetical protein [Betaproteobacteria bacterium]
MWLSHLFNVKKVGSWPVCVCFFVCFAVRFSFRFLNMIYNGRLSSLSHGGGCGCKIAPGVLTDRPHVSNRRVVTQHVLRLHCIQAARTPNTQRCLPHGWRSKMTGQGSHAAISRYQT